MLENVRDGSVLQPSKNEKTVLLFMLCIWVIIFQIKHFKRHSEFPTQFLAKMKDLSILLTKIPQKVIFGMEHLPKNRLFNPKITIFNR